MITHFIFFSCCQLLLVGGFLHADIIVEHGIMTPHNVLSLTLFAQGTRSNNNHSCNDDDDNFSESGM
jgi:hypothetical protein